MSIEKRLEELNIKLPEPPKPVAEYIPYRITGNLVYISGQDCRVDNELKYKGKVGKDVTEEEGIEAARIATIRSLSVLKDAAGNLNNVKKIISVHGYVNSAKGFVNQPFVINGASTLLVEVFGEKGRHSRCALGANELPFDTPVEIELIAEIEDV